MSYEELIENVKKEFIADDGCINDVNKFAHVIQQAESSGRYDLRPLFTEMLKKSSIPILEKFISKSVGGWQLIDKWLIAAAKGDDDDLLIDVLELLGKVPFQRVHFISPNGKPKQIRYHVKKSTKHVNPNVASLSKVIFKRMQKLNRDKVKIKVAGGGTSDKNASSHCDNLSTKTSASSCIAEIPATKVAERVRPILMTPESRASRRGKRALSWLPDDKIFQIRYFDLIEDERCNVSRQNYADQSGSSQNFASSSSCPPSNSPAAIASPTPVFQSSSSFNAASNFQRSVADASLDLRHAEIAEPRSIIPWPKPVPIDFAYEIITPGWNSKQRAIEAERESRVLGAIDLPGQLSTLDEPDQHPKVVQADVIVIPLETVGSAAKVQDYSHIDWHQLYLMQQQQSQLQQHQNTNQVFTQQQLQQQQQQPQHQQQLQSLQQQTPMQMPMTMPMQMPMHMQMFPQPQQQQPHQQQQQQQQQQNVQMNQNFFWLYGPNNNAYTVPVLERG